MKHCKGKALLAKNLQLVLDFVKTADLPEHARVVCLKLALRYLRKG